MPFPANDPLGLTVKRKSDRQILDEALAEQAKGTYVDPVAGARRFLSRDSVVDTASRERGMVRNPETDMWEPFVGPRVRTAGEELQQTLGETGSAMMLPLAFLGGPVGAVAGGAMALEGLKNAYDDPSALNVGLAAAGAIPGVRALRNAGRAGKVAGVADEIADTAQATKRFTVDKLKTPVNRRPATEMGDAIEDALFDTAKQPSLGGELDEVIAASRRNPGPSRANLANIRGYTQNNLDEGLGMVTPELVDDAAGAAQGMPSMDDVMQSLAGLESTLGGVPSSRAAVARATRQAGKSARVERLNQMTEDAVKEFQRRQQHGVAGFSGLPQMSPGELARISAMMERITGR